MHFSVGKDWIVLLLWMNDMKDCIPQEPKGISRKPILFSHKMLTFAWE